MASNDVKKTLSEVKKWNAGSKMLENKQIYRIEKARKALLASEDKLRKDLIAFKGYYEHLFQLNADFEKLAQPAIKLQDDLEKAEKAKDRTKVTELKKKLAPEEKKIAKLKDKFTKNFNEMDSLATALSKACEAVEKLP